MFFKKISTLAKSTDLAFFIYIGENKMIKKLFELENEKNLVLIDEIENIKLEKNKSILLRGNIIQEDNKCPYCKRSDIVRNGTYTSNVLFNKVNDTRITLRLKKQRYTCRYCKRNFIPEVKFLDKYKRISNQLLRRISLESCLTLSNKQISRQNYVSANTVERTQKKFKDYLIINKQSLPKVLCVDEFRGVKNYQSKMNFLIVDGDKHKIKDILLTRHKNNIEKYFLSYSKKVKRQVEYFVIDMYDTYLSVAKKQFPNAKIIIDRFHVKRLMTSSLKNKRIQVMNKYPKYTYQYRVLKKFRNILFKKYEDINTKYQRIRYYEMFYSEYDILKYILLLDKQLEEMYWIYQEFIKAFDSKDIELFKQVIKKKYINISEEMKNTLRTYNKYEEYIINALIYPYSNGVVEGINTKIKLIKRIGYGYRNFQNLRLKILLSFNMLEFVEDIERKEQRILSKQLS